MMGPAARGKGPRVLLLRANRWQITLKNKQTMPVNEASQRRAQAYLSCHAATCDRGLKRITR